jgi:hypothetical protein
LLSVTFHPEGLPAVIRRAVDAGMLEREANIRRLMMSARALLRELAGERPADGPSAPPANEP